MEFISPPNWDEEKNVTYIESHVNFEYRHDELQGGSNSNEFNFTWQQSFGHKHRFAAAIELPIVNVNDEGPEEPSATGLGDLKLRARGMLWKGEKFEHAAEVEITVPSATSEVLGYGQTVLRLVWGFSSQLAKHTLLNGEFAYNKAVANRRSTPGFSSIEPELVLSQVFAKRFGGYLDWDNYYEFSVDE